MNTPVLDSSKLSPEQKRQLLGQLLKQRARSASGTAGNVPTSPASDAFEPFPLRDIQQAYWIGRRPEFELGGVGAHAYVEFDTPRLDVARVGEALNTLIHRHDMLRAVVLENGEQQILRDVPSYAVTVLDLSDAPPDTVARELDALRALLSHRVCSPDQWPLFDLRVTALPGHLTRLHFGIDLLIADLRSIYILLAEWFQLYVDPVASLPTLGTSFREYVLQERAQDATETFERAEAYWRHRMADLPPAPDLPLTQDLTSVRPPRFTRRTARIDPQPWRELKRRAEQHHVTPASVLLTAFGRVLATWSRSPRFTVNATIFNRLPLHQDVPHLVGDFTSVVLVAIDHSAREHFVAQCRRTNGDLWEALDHRAFSGVRVLRDLLRHTGVGRALMPVVFTCDLRHDMLSIKDSARAALPGEVVFGVSQTPQVYLDHQVFEEGGGLTINWDAVDEVFPSGLLDVMFAANVRLLEDLAQSDHAWNTTETTLTPVTDLEAATIANSTDGSIPTPLLHELFVQRAEQVPDSAAVICGDRTLNYRELHARALAVGRRLREQGVRPNSIVAVVMEKGWEQVVGVLGILYAGAAYLPIDPELPTERVHYLLAHGRTSVALTQTRVVARLSWPPGVERLAVDADDWAIGHPAPLEPAQHQTDLAYVIYTSGSTGVPKGVMIDHRGAVNTILDINQRFDVQPGDRVLALSSLSFDLSVWDIFGTLAAGAAIVLPDTGASRDPATWLDSLERTRVTIWNSVPAMMEMLVDYLEARHARAPSDLRLVMMSGDWIPVTLPDRIARLGDHVEVVSLGGATEASIWSILYPIERTAPEWDSIPYGKPMRNQHVYVLDGRLDPRPIGVPGELYIGGIGLAHGYWQDEEKTAARFIVHPTSGERLYRTGDWGAYLADGNIRFLGRDDQQVKIQGYRVELGEIEAALSQHPGVRAAVASAIGDAHGAKRLVAHVVTHETPGPSESDLKAFLQTKLPAYMVPGTLIRLDALPLTANGKVDRSALPALVSTTTGDGTSGTTAVARRVAAVVADTLKVSHVDLHAHVTDVGATSLDVLRIGNGLEREFGFRPTMQEFFRFSNLMGLVTYYEAHLSARSPADMVPIADRDGSAPPRRSLELLVDPDARAAFKRRQPGLRDVADVPRVALPPHEVDATLAAGAFARRSHRAFGRAPIPLEHLAGLLGQLRQQSPDRAKRRYGSAGGLYPVQTYLHITQGRVEGVGAGIYYYDPREHQLARLSEVDTLDRGIHWPENRGTFDEAAFSLFFIAQLGAIAPLYQERSEHFATIEAGLMSQLLEMTAASTGIGLCHIGDLDFNAIRGLFALDDHHVMVHSMLGGLALSADAEAIALEDPTIAGSAFSVRPSSAVGGGDPLAPVAVSDLAADADLDFPIRIGAHSAPAAPSRLFLTGATGFLGAFVLDELLRQSEAEIYCLVRASDIEEGAQRLQQSQQRYGLWDAAHRARILPVPGDLSEPRLGLGEQAFVDLARRIDGIYHCGAHVNMLLPYGDLKTSNVGGTHEVLRLAAEGQSISTHLVSSVAVFPFDGGRVRRESDPLDHGERLLGGYAQSKWVAEKMATMARDRGLPVSIYRPSTITGDSRSGVFGGDSYLTSLIRGCIELGSAPDIDALVDMVPVDFVAKALVTLSRRNGLSSGGTFHLTNPSPLPMSGLVDFMCSFGYALRRASLDAWHAELLALGTQLETNALYPFSPFLGLLARGPMLGPRYACDATLTGLSGTSISCPTIDTRLLDAYFEHFIRTGFLKPPRR